MHIFNCCPVCRCTKFKMPRKDLEIHPYVECSNCGLYFQPKMCDKVYEATHEASGELMSEHDKQVNYSLASALYYNHIKKINSPTYRHLDVGAKYPWLGHCLKKVAAEDNTCLISFGIDGIPEGRKFGAELDIPMIVGNFEEDPLTWEFPDEQTKKAIVTGGLQVVTLIHCIEHLYNPIETLKNIRNMMSDDGILFIRCPDSQFSGIEYEFKQSYYEIHPLIWQEQALYEALAQLKDCFEVYETYQLGNAAQRDYLLRCINKKPLIGSWYIAKNEERDLPKSLESIKSFSDMVRVHDTGSTDTTIQKIEEFAKNNPDIKVEWETNLECSTQNEQGNWQLWSFGESRNKVLEKLEPKVDWLFWIDSDDSVSPETASYIKRIPYAPQDIHGFLIKTGLNGHTHHRLWRSGYNIRFQGACHEYPAWPSNLKVIEHNDLEIFHNGADGVGEGSIQRNLRILKREAESPTVSARVLFYLANTYRDAFGIPTNTTEQKEEHGNRAIETYDRYIAMGGTGYHDELMHAYLYKARVLRFLNRTLEMESVVNKALAIDSSWAELYMELAYSYFQNKGYGTAIKFCDQASELTWKHRLFSEREKYQDQPIRLKTWCLYELGHYEKAHDTGKGIFKWVPTDKPWQDFLDAMITPINLHRLGAIGDILISSCVVEGLKKKHPYSPINYYTAYPEAAALIKGVNIVKNVQNSRVSGVTWDSRKVGYDYNLIGYPLHLGYPDKPMEKHLTEYFCEEVGVPVAEMSLVDVPKLRVDAYATLHIKTGWSIYKEWALDCWEELVAGLHPLMTIVQVGTDDDTLIPLCKDARGSSLKDSVSLIRHAKIHIGVDSFSNHVAGAYKVPAVILFGSTSSTGSGYPTAINIWRGCEKESKINSGKYNKGESPCYRENEQLTVNPKNPPQCPYIKYQEKPPCMQNITVEEVKEAIIQSLWE